MSGKLKNMRIQAEFRGYVETRWEGLQTLAQKYESEDYHVSVSGRVFQQIVVVVYNSNEPVLPHKSGGSLCFPMTFKLPRNNMPPTFEAVAGSISYYIKCSMLYQEPLKLLKTNHEIEVPVEVAVPESAKLLLLRSPSQLTQPFLGGPDKIGCVIELPRRVLTLGETLEVNIAIQSTPPGTALRTMIASLRPVVQYLSNVQHLTQARGAQAAIPRPLSEVVESFPLVCVGREYGTETILRQLQLDIDPSLARASFESPLISCKTVLRVQLTLDNSETPNITYEVPIVVLDPPRDSPPRPSSTPLLHKSRSQVGETRVKKASRDYDHYFVRPPRTVSISSNTRTLYSTEELDWQSPPGYPDTAVHLEPNISFQNFNWAQKQAVDYYDPPAASTAPPIGRSLTIQNAAAARQRQYAPVVYPSALDPVLAVGRFKSLDGVRV
ncbi:hypothetical protein HDU84_009497 [Entophlyctis sp. JEL0112]|nr:hypothetical protein HDU84_009497 [Entophlyctis sp. JEL0112]